MNVIIEGLILSLCLYLSCAWGIKDGPVNMVYLYDKEVQERVVSLGLITEEKIKTSGKRFKTWGLLFYFVYSIICVYVINGAREFLPAFMQFLGILLIMGVFDRIVVDTLWVGHTKAWIIPQTEDLMPYIPLKVHLKKWLITLIFYPIITAIICGIISALL